MNRSVWIVTLSLLLCMPGSAAENVTDEEFKEIYGQEAVRVSVGPQEGGVA